MKELNEEIEGWKAGKKVGYCPIDKHKGRVNRKKLDVALAREDNTSKPLPKVNTPASERRSCCNGIYL